ncbi:MAG: YebC/PmpR family DNA-binding transcriptional regulator [Candidatus Nealsonbacteria bacterium]|nr:YebC/PmpR family DNA-binding transcriptional regulator [Candidatus Nealsonbacteria bacterium]
MSGHSHWASIKHKKGAADAKRSKVFSKLSREITVAAKDGGGDPVFNAKLRMIIDRAKALNMPSDNIERSVKKGTGEIEGVVLEPVLYEAYGPGGVAVIIEGITDNKNRSLGEIKKIIADHGGKMVAEGAIRWLFERRGIIEADPVKVSKNQEELEMAAIESGAEDIYWHADILDIYSKPENLESVKNNLGEKGIEAESAALGWVAKENIQISEKEQEACQKLFEALDENDAVQEIYYNTR